MTARPRAARASAAALLVTLLAGVAMLLGSAPASAAAATIEGTLRAGDTAVEGATVTATGGSGPPVSAMTDATGRFVLAVPDGGTYKVMLETTTLPEGVTLVEGRPNPLTILVPSGGVRAALFALDRKGFTASVVRTNRTLQLIVDGLKFGLIIAMAGVGLSLIFGTTGLTNFAHGELVTLGALSAWYFNVDGKVPFLLSVVLAMLVGALAGAVLELGLWRPLRHRGTGLIAALVVSIGLSLFLRYLYLFFFGGATQPFRQYSIQRPLDLGLITIPAKDLITDIASILVLAAVGLALTRSRLGTAVRAVADNKDLAAASGINVERVVLVVWMVGAALASLGGVFLALTQQVKWDMGFTLLLLIFAGVTLGGLGTAFGALAGGVFVGLFVQLSTLVIPSELKNVGALAVLILVLLVRPTGILGRRERIG